ncbi:MAG: hypothetical protein JST62_13170 [Bacteroidetes bacterium]|nr:hypothetical protein [Bacteroidota bacterium]
MNKLLVSIFLLVGQIIFYSCHLPHDREIICETNFKKARDLAYKNPTDSSALDSALIIVNRSMQCDSIKLAVIDLKIRLLLTLGKYNEGSKFIDSLQSSDFNYSYKKPLNHDNFVALSFASQGDTVSRDRVYKKMAADIESYITGNNLKSKEFQEAFIDLNILQERFLDSIALKKVVDSFKIKYPDEERFFEFFKN